MAKNKNLELKKRIYEESLRKQEALVKTSNEAMLQAQESANEEKGALGEKFESFREQCQLDRDMYAKQLQEAMTGYANLKQIQVEKEYDKVTAGAVVITDTQSLFIAVSIGSIKVDSKNFFVISTQSPLYQAMSGLKKDETFNFRDKNHKIIEVF
ncbi:hypothetical protein BH23BAC1_BH23BAC1_26520 [soil metagenome]